MDFFHSPEFQPRVADLMGQHRVPGLAIAIAHDGQVASAGFGLASIDPPRPCTADTLFDIASSAKSLTAAAVALLAEDNDRYPEVQYSATMASLLPDDFVMPGPAHTTQGVTVDDVLGHRTGMAAHDNSYMGPQAEQPDDARSITRNLRNLPAAAPLRSRYLYCNMMYTAATHLVEVKAKQSFSEFLEEHIFRPLDMQSTSLQPATARAKGLGDQVATGYLWEKDSASHRGFPSPDCPEGQGAGSVITSVNDYIKWVRALMSRQGPVSEKVYQGLTRLRSIVNPTARRLKPHTSPAFYAAGMEVYYYRGQTVVGHEGVIPGFGSRFIFLPGLNFGAVVFGNSAGAGPISTILIRELIDFVLKVPEAERVYKNKPAQGRAMGSLPVRPKPGEQGAQGQSREQPKHLSQERPAGPAKDNGRGKGKNKGKQGANEKKATGKGNPQPTRGPKVKTAPPQEIPLEAYAGRYWHPGYHHMTVQIKDGKLFIDAADRSMGFALTFEHVRDQTRYTAHLCDSLEGGDDPVDAEFVLEGGVAVKMGLTLEAALRDMIWFERVQGARCSLTG